jgi:hypothetical protein
MAANIAMHLSRHQKGIFSLSTLCGQVMVSVMLNEEETNK